MPRVLYGVSPIGLGHASRALVVIRELRSNGAEVKVFSGGNAARFLRSNGEVVDDMVDDPVPRVRDGTMEHVVLWYLRSWVANRRTLRRTERLFDSYRPDVVVGDEEFSGVTVAGRRGVKRVFIADELELGFARTWFARVLERRVERWYRKLQSEVDLLIVPEEGEDVGNLRRVGPIVRKPTMGCEEVRSKFGLPQGGTLVLFSMSGSGIGRELVERLLPVVGRLGATLAISGNRDEKVVGNGVVDLGVVLDNQNLVACADVVVSTAGKSTMDEAASAGTPIVTIPIRHHAEQERNASALGYRFADRDRLPELVESKIGKRETPRDFRGEQIASRLILSLVQPR